MLLISKYTYSLKKKKNGLKIVFEFTSLKNNNKNLSSQFIHLVINEYYKMNLIFNY
jgi:hypothetical protein